MSITYDPRGKTLNKTYPIHTEPHNLNAKTGTYNESRMTVSMNGANLATAYGLHLTEYYISAPQPDIKLIDIPGRPGKLDASLALTGEIVYKARKIEMKFHTRKTHTEWHAMMSTLSAAFSGIECECVFSVDPNYYYKGRFLIDYEKTNPVSGDVVISCDNVFPYRLQLQEKRARISANATQQVYFEGKTYNGPLLVRNPTSVNLAVEWNGERWTIAGNKTTAFRLIHLQKGTNFVAFINPSNSPVDIVVTWEGGEL